MGGTTFTTRAKGATAREAFAGATESARHQYGHGGYTGTIAEKSTFKVVKLPAGMSVEAYIDVSLEDEDHVAYDKWGPAACLDLGGGEFLFFGWASE